MSCGVRTNLPDPDDAVTTRELDLQGTNAINGQSLDMDRIDTVVTVDTTEIWEVSNASGSPHNFHVHDVQFRVLERDGEPVPPELAGRKDTVFIAPNETVRLAVRFADYTNAALPYMYHCHVLAHEDAGMMGQFVVVEPGQRARRPPTHHGRRR